MVFIWQHPAYSEILYAKYMFCRLLIIKLKWGTSVLNPIVFRTWPPIPEPCQHVVDISCVVQNLPPGGPSKTLRYTCKLLVHTQCRGEIIKQLLLGANRPLQITCPSSVRWTSEIGDQSTKDSWFYTEYMSPCISISKIEKKNLLGAIGAQLGRDATG